MFHNTAEEQKLFYSCHLYTCSSQRATKPRRNDPMFDVTTQTSQYKKKHPHNLLSLFPKPPGNALTPLYGVLESSMFLS